MTIKSSGVISISDINVELSKASNTLKSLNDADIRSLLGKATGAISLGDAYGKSAVSAGIGGTFTTGKTLYYTTLVYTYGWMDPSTIVLSYQGTTFTGGIGSSSSKYFVDPNGVKIYSILSSYYLNSYIYEIHSDTHVTLISLYLSIPGHGTVKYYFNFFGDNAYGTARYVYRCSSPPAFTIPEGSVVTVSF